MASLKSPVTKQQTQQTLIDQVSDSVFYIGNAKVGEPTTAARWQIRKITTVGNVTSVQYANGSDSYNQIWDNRSSLSYS